MNERIPDLTEPGKNENVSLYGTVRLFKVVECDFVYVQTFKTERLPSLNGLYTAVSIERWIHGLTKWFINLTLNLFLALTLKSLLSQ